MKKVTLYIFLLLIWLLPFIYLLNVYSKLPATVAIHFNIKGEADKYGTPQSVLINTIIISGMSLLIFLLLKFLPLIDPKKKIKYSETIFNKIAVLIVILMSVLNIIIIHSSLNGAMKTSGTIMFFTLGLAWAYIGNLMPSMKPNYFVGIRTPWTLESEDNWRATHNLGGKIWFIGGILLAVLCLILPASKTIIAFISITTIIALVPVIYSFIYFKKHKHSS
jgi:uncharacterized membrane protein